jgi:hypothetical protein
MPFSIQKALDAGKSEDDIFNYLTSVNPKFNAQKAIKSGKSKSDISSYLADLKKPDLKPTPEPMEPDTGLKRTLTPALMVKNLPKNAVEIMSTLYQAASHPQQTKNAITGLIGGMLQKAIPGDQPLEKYADQAWNIVVEKYGGIENIQKTMSEKPLDVMLDIASISTGVGGVLKATGMKKAGDIAVEVGKTFDPTLAAAKGLQKAGNVITGKLPEIMYKHAAGIPTTMKPKKRIEAINTALEEAIPLSQTGVDRLFSKINKIDSEVRDIVKTGGYKTASMDTINSHIDSVIGKKYPCRKGAYSKEKNI